MYLRPCYTRQLFCSFQRNVDGWKALQVAKGVSHVRNISSQLATRPLEIVYNFFPGYQLEISCQEKTLSDWLFFFLNKIAFKIAIYMSHAATCLATLRKVEDSSTFLRNNLLHCRLQKWGVKYFFLVYLDSDLSWKKTCRPFVSEN